MFQNPFIQSADDLVTSREAIRAGFLEAVLARSHEEIPYLDRANALLCRLKTKTHNVGEVLQLPNVEDALLDAAGVMQKTRRFLETDEKRKLIQDFLKKVIAPTGEQYAEEIVYRYLMSLGEQLGGRMRNLVGRSAQAKFSRTLLSQIRLSKLHFAVHGKNGKWLEDKKADEFPVENIRAIRWRDRKYNRTLVYNLTVPGIGGRTKNVDIVIFNCQIEDITAANLKKLMTDSRTLHLMGELKGGIDPAGGDEHWKTARGALERIREAYKKAYVIFIAAAIEKAMSSEIFVQLQSGQLDYAANLTNVHQLNAICQWIVEQ